MNVAGLFSGIGGLELPFETHDVPTALLCDAWEASRSVLQARFPGTPMSDDIRSLAALPEDVTVVTAGFPCTDLSQAGRTAGIRGKESGLVAHVFRLLEARHVDWLVLENVRNMLVLDSGRAMSYLVGELERLGFRWAYRLVDSRFTGVPQRRHRVLLVASRHHDPRTVLFADEAGEPEPSSLRQDAFGFYWTEGLTGLGWAQDAVPPLKGGSGLGIPSPPAIWIPGAEPGQRIVTPGIEDAEALQGFARGWTAPAQSCGKKGTRWKLIGNAVTVGVAQWLVERLLSPGEVVVPHRRLPCVSRWPESAYGASGQVWEFRASHWPLRREYRHLLDLLTHIQLTPLSHRASAGFFSRVKRSALRFDADFVADLECHLGLMRSAEPRQTDARVIAA